MQQSPEPDSSLRVEVFRWWNIGFAYTLLASVGYTLLSAGNYGWDETARVLVGFLGFAVVYVLVGYPGYRNNSQLQMNIFLVLIIAIALNTGQELQTGRLFLDAIGVACCWMFSGWSRLRSSIFLTLFTGGAWLTTWLHGGRVWSHFWPHLLWGAVVLGLCIAAGSGLISLMKFAERHRSLARTLALTQEQVARQEHAAGVVAERERVAREVHDTLAQGFLAEQMMARQARQLLEVGDLGLADEVLGNLEVSAANNLAEARSLVAAYSPVLLQGATLAEALRQLVARWEKETGVEVEVGVDESTSLAPSEDVVVLRTVQEALTNVRRHAHASRVWLGLCRGEAEGEVILRVVDDGRGIAVDTQPGYGMAAMTARAQMVGGIVAHEAGPGGRGTAVTMTLPAGRRSE